MGKKARIKQIPVMTRAIYIFFVFCGLTRVAWGTDEIPIRFLYEDAADRLSTEKMWVVDPDEINPHRQRWALQRQVELLNLAAVESQPGRYSVKTTGLLAKTRGYFRGPGPWYQSFEKFGCEKSPVSWFATEAGTQRVVKTAKEVWERIINENRVKLELALRGISEKTPLAAQSAAYDLFERWKAELNLEWRNRGKAEVRKAEWEDYWVEARVAKLCLEESKLSSKSPSVQPAWESLIEAPPEVSEVQPPTILARAPARRWDGLYSIRATVHAAGKSLTGQFLLDSTLPTSVISPMFLKLQGAEISSLKEPGAHPLRVSWSGGGGVGVPIRIDHLDIAGHDPGLKRFFAVETELFSPPESISNCCDGILGADFFRKNILDFRTEPTPSVVIWSRPGFRPELKPGSKGDSPWIEVALTPEGAPVSACRLTRAKVEDHEAQSFYAVKWDTGADVSVDIHPEVRKKIAHYPTSKWDLNCGSLKIASELKPTSSENGKTAHLSSSQIPAATIGMQVLGRGSVIYDFPHGRIWFSNASLAESVPENRSGVAVEYVYLKGERELQVKELKKGTAADVLIQAGLRPGMLLEKIGGRDVSELDQWQADRHLAGVHGKKVILEWTSNRRTKSIALQLK